MQLAEMIAMEVMDAIEHHRRINKDDLITAAEVAISKYRKDEERQNPLLSLSAVRAAAPVCAGELIHISRDGTRVSTMMLGAPGSATLATAIASGCTIEPGAWNVSPSDWMKV